MPELPFPPAGDFWYLTTTYQILYTPLLVVIRMKRILVRIAVLGTVVGLGLIAIAQAQRSQPSPEAPTAAATAFTSDGSSDSSCRRPARRATRCDTTTRRRPLERRPTRSASPTRSPATDRRRSARRHDPSRKPVSDPFAGLRDNR